MDTYCKQKYLKDCQKRILLPVMRFVIFFNCFFFSRSSNSFVILLFLLHKSNYFYVQCKRNMASKICDCEKIRLNYHLNRIFHNKKKEDKIDVLIFFQIVFYSKPKSWNLIIICKNNIFVVAFSKYQSDQMLKKTWLIL